MTWIPKRGNLCLRQIRRCSNARPVSEVLWKKPDLEGAVSAYKFHTAEDEAVISKFFFIKASILQIKQLTSFFIAVDDTGLKPADWIVLNDTECFSFDVDQVETMRPASSIYACIEQCYGLIL